MDPLTLGPAVSTGVAAIKGAIALTRGIVETSRTLGKIEMIQQVLELQGSMADILQSHMELLQENWDLREQNRSLHEAIETKQDIISEHGAYWTKIGDAIEGPFDSICWDTKHQLVRMQECGETEHDLIGVCRQYNCSISGQNVLIPMSFLIQNKAKYRGSR